MVLRIRRNFFGDWEVGKRGRTLDEVWGLVFLKVFRDFFEERWDSSSFDGVVGFLKVIIINEIYVVRF